MMPSFAPELPVHYLKPAEIFISDQPAIVTTTLGSCVSVVFFNRRQRLGAICHALLPSSHESDHKFKFVDSSIAWMLDHFILRGIKPSQLQVKLFGGSDMLESFREQSSATIGQQNIHKALEIFKDRGLKITSSNVGGINGRKIFFYTHTGKILMKRIKKACWLDLEK
jgi:chemotaxis protein CheD